MAEKLESEEYSIERAALGALKAATGPLDLEILKSIAEKLEHEKTAIQILALVALGEHLGDSFDRSIQKKIENKLRDKHPPIVQITALLVLGRISPSDPEVQKLIDEKLKDETLYAMAETIALSIFERTFIYNSTISRPNEKSIDREEKRLDMYTTYNTARFIFKGIDFFDPEISQLIAEKLEDKNPIVRVITLFILAEFRSIDLEIQKQIEKKQEDKNPVVRKTAKTALERLLSNAKETTYNEPPQVELEIEVGERPESSRVEAEIIETPETPRVEINMEAFNFEPDQMEIEIRETPEPEQIERR